MGWGGGDLHRRTRGGERERETEEIEKDAQQSGTAQLAGIKGKHKYVEERQREKEDREREIHRGRRRGVEEGS